MERTFFDHIGVADMERVHSATIAWILSDNCRALSINEKKEILSTLFKTEKSSLVSIKPINEYQHLDMVVVTTDETGQEELWVLENKVKAPLAYNQLGKYTKKIKEGKIDEKNKEVNDLIRCIGHNAHHHLAVLSLIGWLRQDGDSGEWKTSTYEELSAVLNSICMGKNETEISHMAIVDEYRKCISNLVSTLADFRKNPQAFPHVFTDGNKAKAYKTTINRPDTIGYIAENGLETLFQKSYFTDIVNEIIDKGNIEFERCHVGESRGNADFAFHFGSFGNDSSYEFDLSFQNGAFKLAVCKKYYPDLKGHEKELGKWKAAFEDKDIRKNYPDYSRINIPRGKARLSISYNIGNDWYKRYKREAFIKLIIDQVKIGRRMAREITEKRESGELL